ncbi:MAG: 4Fe-4S binding protein [Deltaproteobacteria bacterium]|nr:4Fe-4S binding protein [Deltaproteobacteria bacterium]
MQFFTIAGMILRSLFGKPATLMYPVVQREYVQGNRGHIEIAIEDCIFCGLCQRKCPTDAITVDRAEKLWEIQRLRCISCSSCTEACPKKCLAMKSGYSAAVCIPGEKEQARA